MIEVLKSLIYFLCAIIGTLLGNLWLLPLIEREQKYKYNKREKEDSFKDRDSHEDVIDNDSTR